MKNKDFINSKKVELIAIANAMLAGDIQLLVGVREICNLRHLICDPDNKIFIPFRAIDSETDHFPVGDIRDKWNEEALKKSDINMEKYLAETRDDILMACREMIKRLSSEETHNLD